jgi:hypothetical protein
MALVEERCYVLHTQYGAKDYFDIYEEMGRKLQTETLGGLLGYYATEVGELNAVVSLWNFETFEDRQKRRALLASNPDWLAFLRRVRPMIRTMNNRLLVPAPFSPAK